MSRERPKAPLWPEGISKVRPVENQRTQALTEGVFAPVAKQPELSKPGGQTGENPIFKHAEELQWRANLKGEPAPFQPNPKVRQATERLGKPPPQEATSTIPYVEQGQTDFFRRPLITEAERVINERWATAEEKLRRYPPGQKERIASEWFDRVTSTFKPQELTPQILIETLKMLEEGIERASTEPLDIEPQANQHSNTSTGQETS